MTTATQTVRDAISATAASARLRDHWTKLLSSRAGLAQPSGSYVPDVDTDGLLCKLKVAGWEEFAHPAISAPAKGYITREISGNVGLVALNTLPPETPVELADGHSTGFLSAIVRGGEAVSTDFTVMLIGPDDGPTDPEIVWTFHPGLPVRPSSLKVDGIAGTKVTAAEAIALGFNLAKIGS